MGKKRLVQDATVLQAWAPVENDGSVLTGTTIDRLGYQSLIFQFANAASSGSPTTATAKIELYHDDASGMGTEALLEEFESALNVKTAGQQQYHFSLDGAKRYIRVKVDITYADGSSPKNIVAGTVVLGDKNIGPAVSESVLS